jgi:predicted transcriptional regulator
VIPIDTETPRSSATGEFEPGGGGYTLPEVGELFNRVNSVISEEQETISVRPDTRVGEALGLMRERNFSQLPIIAGEQVLGMFSHRSFALGVPALQGGRERLEDLPVEEFLEMPAWARASDELGDLLPDLDRYDAVCVGDQENLQGIVTAVDLARFLERLSTPFVRLQEIELTLRALIQARIPAEVVAECARDALAEMYADRVHAPPDRLEDMALGELVRLVGDGRTWPHLGGALGASRQRTAARLKALPSLRNVVFHFRRALTDDELDEICGTRDWLLRRLRTVREEAS